MNLVSTPTEPVDQADTDRVRMIRIVTPDIRQAREIATAIGHSQAGFEAALESMDNPTLRGFLLGQDRYSYTFARTIGGYFLALKFDTDDDVRVFDTLASLTGA